MDIKPSKLKLRVVWCKNFLGLAINQLNSNGEYFLTRYYFWPKTEAWEQLKLELDTKLWLTSEEKVEILKISSDAMKYWLLYRNTKTVEKFKTDFPKLEIINGSYIGL